MQVLALHDKPSPKSFGMMGFVGRTDGQIRMYFGTSHAPLVTESDLANSIKGGHLRDVSDVGAEILTDVSRMNAGWLGSIFASRAAELGVPVVVPDVHWKTTDGRFWIEASTSIYGRLKRWTEKAAFRAVAGRDRTLAAVMCWALPLDEVTSAVNWYVRSPGLDRESYLNLQVRVTPKQTAEALEASYAQEIERIRNMAGRA